MSVKMRIIQVYDPAHENEFLALESQFAELEKNRADFPQGERYRPISSSLPTHTLVWESVFPSVVEANAALQAMNADNSHEELAKKQRPYFKEIKVEFLQEI